jgi:two-component system cell cycle response regulator
MARILLVEDNPNNLELMRYLLAAAGHAVTCAATGADGVMAALSAPPELVVLDIQLPDTTGPKVLSTMRTHRSLDGCRIVTVTANAMVGDRETALAAGFDGYLSKPIDPRGFAAAIEALLPRRIAS